MKTDFSRFLGASVVLILSAGVLTGAWVYRDTIRNFLVGPNRNAVQSSASISEGEIIEIEVGASGFSPEAVAVASNENLALRFTRTAEKTCITSVVFPGTGQEFELPYGEQVLVPLSIKPDEVVQFTCPMDMFHGAVMASGLAENSAATHEHNSDEIAYWTCSMHPSVKSNTPGTCPICSMDLISVTKREVETGVIHVDAKRRQLIGLTTDAVTPREMGRELRLLGRVVVDETRVAEITLRYDAWIGEVFADYTGKVIHQGDPMFTLYNPQLWSLQEEYLEALRRGTENRSGGPGLAEAAETRLRLWGIGSEQIEKLKRSGKAEEYLTIRAPISGTVLEKVVLPGSAVDTGTALYRIADLSTVWIEAEVFEQDLQHLKVGQHARIILRDSAGVEVSGSIAYIYPELRTGTRTGRARIEIPNPNGELKLEMYADVYVNFLIGERLAIPESAVIYAGKSQVVFVDLGEGRLEPRRVEVGMRANGFVEITDGVHEGEVVVTSANFLIAAESKLKSGIEKW